MQVTQSTALRRAVVPLAVTCLATVSLYVLVSLLGSERSTTSMSSAREPTGYSSSDLTQSTGQEPSDFVDVPLTDSALQAIATHGDRDFVALLYDPYHELADDTVLPGFSSTTVLRESSDALRRGDLSPLDMATGRNMYALAQRALAADESAAAPAVDEQRRGSVVLLVDASRAALDCSRVSAWLGSVAAAQPSFLAVSRVVHSGAMAESLSRSESVMSDAFNDTGKLAHLLYYAPSPTEVPSGSPPPQISTTTAHIVAGDRTTIRAFLDRVLSHVRHVHHVFGVPLDVHVRRIASTLPGASVVRIPSGLAECNDILSVRRTVCFQFRNSRRNSFVAMLEAQVCVSAGPPVCRRVYQLPPLSRSTVSPQLPQLPFSHLGKNVTSLAHSVFFQMWRNWTTSERNAPLPQKHWPSTPPPPCPGQRNNVTLIFTYAARRDYGEEKVKAFLQSFAAHHPAPATCEASEKAAYLVLMVSDRNTFWLANSTLKRAGNIILINEARWRLKAGVGYRLHKCKPVVARFPPLLAAMEVFERRWQPAFMMLSDARDVLFQDALTPAIADVAGTARVASFIAVVLERHLLAAVDFHNVIPFLMNRRWVAKTYGSNMTSALANVVLRQDNPSTYGGTDGKSEPWQWPMPIPCAGLLFGTPQALIAALRLLVVTMETQRKCYANDQGALIGLLVEGLNASSYGHAVLYLDPHVSRFTHVFVGRDILWDADGKKIVNCNGVPYAVLHQLDRHEEVWSRAQDVNVPRS